VDVEFRTKRLRTCYAEAAAGAREWGDKVARRYVERINILKSAKSAAELHLVAALRLHPLKGARHGLHSITLVDRWRMVVTFRDDALTVVRIEEVSAHYGD
jgi:proteic killer suppression protein